GFASGIMWPGTISTASRTLPFGGTAMFALLALAGDLGGSIGPALVGTVSELAGGSLQVGILAGTVFPVLLIVGILLLRRDGAKKA
ncbi:MAG: MFS transporter, partial [Clostridia bacterium]|nr:MFS transporter [Clostridia bacterium]